MASNLGLSILIPIYNVSVVKLVDELLSQLSKAPITNYQIMCFDDGSQDKYKALNTVLNSRFRVNYVELSTNHGRAKIRNRLASMAQYDHLLYLDADSGIVSKRFIKKYIQSISISPEAVIVGGRIYNKKPPRAKAKYLHWKYGTRCESKELKSRIQHPSRYFHTNNFVSPRELMIKHPFDETIEGYGYEDIVFGERLSDGGVNIKHIDNPIKHLDLCKSEVFLNKQAKSIQNLALLYKNKNIRDTSLLKTYERLRKFNLISIYHYVYDRLLQDKIENNLKSNNPKIINLQLHKLYLLINNLHKGLKSN